MVPCTPVKLALSDAVERKIENVVVVQRPVGRALAIDRIERPREQERDLLFAKSAMRAQAMPGQLAEIVILAPCADNGLAVAENSKIAFAIERKIVLRTNLIPVEHQFYARQSPAERHHGRNIARLAQMHAHERS